MDQRGTPAKASDSEKITVNLGFVDLGRMDLLIEEGFFANRADFIRSAIRGQLAAHEETLRQASIRKTLEIGLRDYRRSDLEAVVAAGTRLDIRVVGLARFAADVTPDLARAAIASITVLGALQASPEVRAALADRIH